MFKMNKKGFVLVETLIVTVFVATIFTVMYTNFFPMFGEYERREKYDDIDSIYNSYLIKRMFENPNFRGEKESNYFNYKNQITSLHPYAKMFEVDYKNNDDMYNNVNTLCTNFASSQYVDYCTNALYQMKVEKIYLTNYTISYLKNKLKEGVDETEIDTQTQDYIDSLPYFKYKTADDLNYRIIVKYAKEINKESQEYRKVVYSFSTIGVAL